jgi:hypothetical protein
MQVFLFWFIISGVCMLLNLSVNFWQNRQIRPRTLSKGSSSSLNFSIGQFSPRTFLLRFSYILGHLRRQRTRNVVCLTLYPPVHAALPLFPSTTGARARVCRGKEQLVAGAGWQ